MPPTPPFVPYAPPQRPPRLVRQRFVQVVHTTCVAGQDPTQIDQYEIHFAPDDGPDAPVTVLATRDVELYRRAATAEGTPIRFDVMYHHARTAKGKPCQVLDSLEAV